MAVESTLVPNDVVQTGAPSQFGPGVGVEQTLVPNDVVQTGAASQFGPGAGISNTVVPNNVVQTGGGSQFAGTIRFTLKGYNTTLMQYVYWESWGTADFAALYAGYPPVQIVNIAVIAEGRR